MPQSIVTAPKGPLHSRVTDFTTYLDEDNNLIQYGQDIVVLRANEAITRWAAVALVEATATVPVSVELLDVSDAYASGLFKGVAIKAAAAGDLVPIVRQGITLAKIDTSDPIRGSLVTKGGADGQLGTTLIGAMDATIVATEVLGVYLDVENASDLAPVNLWGR